MRRQRRNTFTLTYQDGYGTATYMDELETILNNTILKSKNGTLTAAPGPTQDNPFDCGVAVCLKNYVLIFHPNPDTMDWPKLMKIPHLLLQFRRFILMSICTGKIHNIFDSTSSTGLPISARIQLQTELPFRPASQELDPSAANPQALRRQEKRALPASNPVYTLDDSDDDNAASTPPHPAPNTAAKRRRIAKVPLTTTRPPISRPTLPTHQTNGTNSNPSSSDDTDEDEIIPTVPKPATKRSIAQLNLEAPRNLNERKRRKKQQLTQRSVPPAKSETTTATKPHNKRSRQHRRKRRKQAPTRDPPHTPSEPPPLTHPSFARYRETLGSTAPDSYSGYRGILQRYQIANGRQSTRTALAQRGIPPPPSHAFAWNSTAPMTAWLADFRHHTYQAYCNAIHSKAATLRLHKGDTTDPWHKLIAHRRDIDAQGTNFHQWQQQHLANASAPRHSRPTYLDERDYIGIGITLNVNIHVTSTNDNTTATAYSLASTTNAIHLNMFTPLHYDIQQHPRDSPPTTAHDPTKSANQNTHRGSSQPAGPAGDAATPNREDSSDAGGGGRRTTEDLRGDETTKTTSSIPDHGARLK